MDHFFTSIRYGRSTYLDSIWQNVACSPNGEIMHHRTFCCRYSHGKGTQNDNPQHFPAGHSATSIAIQHLTFKTTVTMDPFPGNEAMFIKWFWRGDNGNRLIHKLNAYSFNNNGDSSEFIRREKFPPTIYGLTMKLPAEAEASSWYRSNVNHSGQIRLMKIGFTHRNIRPDAPKVNRMKQVRDRLKKNLDIEDSDIDEKEAFVLPINFIDTTDYLEVERDVRARMGFPLQQKVAIALGVSVTPSEWVLTSAKVSTALMEAIKVFKKYYLTENDTPRRVLSTEVFNFHDFKYEKYDPDLLLLSESISRAHDKHLSEHRIGSEVYPWSFPSITKQKMAIEENYTPMATKINVADWFTRNATPKDWVVAHNSDIFKHNGSEGPFVRLEKSPVHIYGVAIDEEGQNEHPFWKELHRLGLKLVKVGLTQEETIKGSGNDMEIIQKQIKRDMRFESSAVFCEIIDFTITTTFREVEEDIRRKVGLKLEQKLGKWLQLPEPTKWVLTSQEMINMMLNGKSHREDHCGNEPTVYTTTDMKPCDVSRIEKLANEINLNYIGLKDNEVVMFSEEEVLVECFKKTFNKPIEHRFGE